MTANANLRKPRRLWLRWVVRVVGVVLLLIAFAPWLVGRTPLRHLVARLAMPKLHGKLHIGSASLGWLWPVVLENVEIKDREGRTLLSAPRIASRKSLLVLLANRSDLGSFEISRPRIHLVCAAEQTNAERTFARFLLPAPPAAPCSPVAAVVEVTEASVQLEDEQTSQRFHLPPINLTLQALADGGLDLRLGLHGPLADAGAATNLDADMIWKRIDKGADPPLLQGELKARLTAVPLGMLTPLLRRLEPACRLEGLAHCKLDARWGSADPAAPWLTVEGELAGPKLALEGAWLGKETLQLADLTAPCRLQARGKLLHIDKLGAQCDLGKVEMTGALDLTAGLVEALVRPGQQLSAELDLGRLASRLPGLLEMPAGSQLNEGRLTLQANSKVQDGEIVWQGQLSTTDLRGQSQGQPCAWLKPLSLVFAARQDTDNRLHLDRLHCDAGFGQLDAHGSPEQIEARVDGDLEALAGQLGQFYDLRDLSLAGKGSLTARLHWNRHGAEIEQANLTLHNLHLHGLGLFVDEPSIQVRTAGVCEMVQGRLELRHFVLTSPGLSVQAERLRLDPTPEGTLAVGTNAEIKGDVAVLQRWLHDPKLPPGDPIHGQIDAHLTCQPSDGRTLLHLRGALQDLTLGPPAAPYWKEPWVQMHGHAEYLAFIDEIHVGQLHLENPACWVDLQGKIIHLSTTQDLSLAGQLQYDLEKLSPFLRPYLGNDFTMLGRETRPCRISGVLNPAALVGPKPPPGTGPLWTMSAEASAGWKSAQVCGLAIGPGDLALHLENGCLRARPVTCAVSQGAAHMQPSLLLEPGPMELVLAGGPVLDHVQVTQALCAGVLGYALPPLADASQAQAVLSLNLDAGRMPLDDPRRAQASGQLVIHSGTFSAGPLIRELALLLNGEPVAQIAPNSVVPVRLADGRIHHENLELLFSGVRVRTQGSVGLDGTLALVVEMPIPPAWLSKIPGGGAALAQRTIRIPIGGTVAQPQVDEKTVRELTAQLLRDAAGGSLQNKIDKGLNKLLGPRR